MREVWSCNVEMRVMGLGKLTSDAMGIHGITHGRESVKKRNSRIETENTKIFMAAHRPAQVGQVGFLH